MTSVARLARVSPAGYLCHVYNRGNGRLRLFNSPEEYEDFLALLQQGRQHADIRLMGFCIMPTHWHLLLLPTGEHDLAAYVGWVSNAHVRRWHQRHRSVGGGHVYQGRYRSFLVQPGAPCLSVLRYIESNPIRTGLVEDTRQWPWSSLAARQARAKKVALDPPSASLPKDWNSLVKEPMPEPLLKTLRISLRRSRPFGTPTWCAETVERFALQHTLRNPWRPKSSPAASG